MAFDLTLKNQYQCLNRQVYQQDGYALVPLREEDIFLIKDWRNDQMDVLRQNQVLTDDNQRNYYKNFISPSFQQPQPDIILFSLLLNGQCIGYGGLTNIDWPNQSAEVSFLLATERVQNVSLYQQSFSVFLALLKQVMFDDLKGKRLFTETYDIRPYHVAVLEAQGFLLIKRLERTVCIGGNWADSLIHEIKRDT